MIFFHFDIHVLGFWIDSCKLNSPPFFILSLGKKKALCCTFCLRCIWWLLDGFSDA